MKRKIKKGYSKKMQTGGPMPNTSKPTPKPSKKNLAPKPKRVNTPKF